MIVGLALAGRGQIGDASCDQYVADGMRAIRATYALQTPAGDFSTRSDAITALGGGANAMHFFMAWSNHALPLLEQSPYGATYATELAMLRPHVERAMDYLVLHGRRAVCTHHPDNGRDEYRGTRSPSVARGRFAVARGATYPRSTKSGRGSAWKISPFWAQAASTRRAFFSDTMHPLTGLAPNYATFEGHSSALRVRGAVR